jgi:hypothetical protein
MITIYVTGGRLSQKFKPLPDLAVTEIAGRRYTAESWAAAICELARTLVAAGVVDDTWEAVNMGAPGTVALRGQSIRAMAALTIKGSRFVKWTPPIRCTSASPMRAAAETASEGGAEAQPTPSAPVDTEAEAAA